METLSAVLRVTVCFRVSWPRFHKIYTGLFTQKDGTVATKESTHRGTVTGHTHIFRHGNRRILSTHTQTCARTDTHILQSCYIYPHATRGNRSRRSLVAGIQCRPTFKFFDTVINAQILNHRVFQTWQKRARTRGRFYIYPLNTHGHAHALCVWHTHTHTSIMLHLDILMVSMLIKSPPPPRIGTRQTTGARQEAWKPGYRAAGPPGLCVVATHTRVLATHEYHKTNNLALYI